MNLFLLLLIECKKSHILREGTYAGYRLVYSLFGSEELKDTDLIDHIDTDRGNNRIGNLIRRILIIL